MLLLYAGLALVCVIHKTACVLEIKGLTDNRIAFKSTLMRKRTYTVLEAGEILGVARSAAYRAAKEGHIPTIRIGKRLLVPVPALAKLLGMEEKDMPLSGRADDYIDG